MTEDLAVSLARMEGKLDASLARLGFHDEAIADHDKRLRDSASLVAVSELDGRVRSLETRSVVTPAGLLAALVAFATLLGAVAAVVALFT